MVEKFKLVDDEVKPTCPDCGEFTDYCTCFEYDIENLNAKLYM